ncbi:hypothetical protein BT69DRAFT_1257148 [Atractiella rhizophila]|nr:hypothetical protein BT69DRAFT_1257148 [Atractiella rhizophila]
MTSSATQDLDPFTHKAEDSHTSPQDKITKLHEILKAASTGMLVTRSSTGHLHSRAMHPASPETPTSLTLYFLANNASHKFDEIQNDHNVNVSFYDPKTTNWASYSGTATVSQDKELIKKHWHSSMKAYFGDLKDGTHKGDEHDPRVSVIEVVPNEIRFWVGGSSGSGIARTATNTVNAALGKTSDLGDLFMLTENEIQLVTGLHKK